MKSFVNFFFSKESFFCDSMAYYCPLFFFEKKNIYRDDKIVIGHGWPWNAMDEKRPWPITVHS